MERAKQLMAMTEKNEALIYDACDYIWKNPEPGYKEWKTTKYMEEQFEKLGYTLVKAGNIPGFYADLDTGRPGPKVAILGELDSLIVGNHPECDKETCAVHACGHNAQCATLLGVAAAMKEPGALDGMCGSIRFMAVPAEELIELGFREGLRKQGIIKYYGGKVEFISRGYFDGVDMAMMIHSGKLAEGKTLAINKGSNGCVPKNITFKGVSSHAGGCPEQGSNALFAANCGMNAVNAIRETFVDGEHIRFHPILTEAGLAVNAIHETAKMESYVRGASFESIYEYNKKVNLALAGAAASIGCHLELDDHPGYFPLNNNPMMSEVVAAAMEEVSGPGSVEISDRWGTGCTDMGDVSAIMPAVHPHSGGAIGKGHGMDYYIDNKKLACLLPAQCLAVALDKLLKDDGAAAKKILAESKNHFESKEAYLAAIDSLNMNKEAVTFNENGTVTLDYCK